jgi:hypothetical protein
MFAKEQVTHTVRTFQLPSLTVRGKRKTPVHSLRPGLLKVASRYCHPWRVFRGVAKFLRRLIRVPITQYSERTPRISLICPLLGKKNRSFLKRNQPYPVCFNHHRLVKRLEPSLFWFPLVPIPSELSTPKGDPVHRIVSESYPLPFGVVLVGRWIIGCPIVS